MRISISDYKDFPVNSFQRYDEAKREWVDIYPEGTRQLYTDRCAIKVPGFGFIGRVDHYMKTSVKKIVDAYVRQVVKREGVLGTYELVINLNESEGAPDYTRKPADEIRINITAE